MSNFAQGLANLPGVAEVWQVEITIIIANTKISIGKLCAEKVDIFDENG